MFSQEYVNIHTFLLYVLNKNTILQLINLFRKNLSVTVALVVAIIKLIAYIPVH